MNSEDESMIDELWIDGLSVMDGGWMDERSMNGG
jgi:hypothetical protein